MGISPFSTSRLAERYEIERVIGRGATATVYLARDLKHHRPVALKVLHPDLSAAVSADRFLREIDIAARLTHPHVLPLYDSGEADGLLYYVMPYVEGEALRERLDREGQLPVRDALCIARGVAAALEYAHAHGVVHRDIKPENILLESGHAVVADFGIARALQQDEGTRITATGVTVGTPAYMSPEQSAADPKLDGRSDVYALGCVLYELLAGEPPFTGPTAQVVLAKRLTGEAPDLRTVRASVPEAVRDVVARALARAPADRFQSAGELAQVLSALEAECATDSTGVRPQRRQARRPAARPALVAGGAALAALAVASLVAAPRLSQHSGGRPPAIRTLAVLPLANLSGKPDQEYLADGLTEALITDLARIDGLNVISRTSVMQYKQMGRMGQMGGQIGQMGARKPLPQIARELRADAVLEGSVIRDGERVRVTAQLIRAADDQHLWAQSYDHQVRDVLALQSEVATAVAREVGLRLSPAAARAPRQAAVKPEAQEAYLKGLYYAGQWRLEDAIASFQRAVAIDSSHAPAYAGLARAYYFRAFFSEVPPVEAFGEMRRAATAALERDETLADAHALLALVSTHHDWDWKTAEQHFARALALSPSNAQVHHDFAHLLLALGRRRESVEQSRRAVELDPANPMLTSCLGWHSLFDDQYDSTVVYAREAQRMMPSFWAQVVLGWAYLGRGEADAAVREMRKAVALSHDLPFAKAALAHALARAGERREARAILAELLDRARHSYVSAYDLAIVYAGLGENDRAFEWLRRATDERSIFIVHLAWDSRLDPLRADPRFQELVARVGVPTVKPAATRTASRSAAGSSSGRSAEGQM